MNDRTMTDVDEETLAEAYNSALDLEKAGDYDAAAKAYRRVLEIDPIDRGGASVRLAAMARGDTPKKAPDAYVATLFDQHAEVFDNVLVDQLDYCVPLMVRDLLAEKAPGSFNRMLDLGCGTGLSGEALGDRTGHATGVDISEGMVEIAYDKDVYDNLYVAEAVAFLEDPGVCESWDLIVATDVLPYLGALERFFAAIAARLSAGGSFAFSSETLPESVMAGRSYMVGAHQRFAHAEGYVLETLKMNGFLCRSCEPITVRLQDGAPVPGHLVLAEKLRA